MIDVPFAISLAAWTICLLSLAPAVWRMIVRRPRWVDPLLGLIFLLALNRLSFLLLDVRSWSRGSSAVLALSLAWLARSYQLEDRRRGNAG